MPCPAQVRSATKLLKRAARAELGPQPPGGKRAKANPAAPGMCSHSQDLRILVKNMVSFCASCGTDSFVPPLV